MARKRQLINEDRRTIITLKSVGLSFREIAKQAKVSVRTVSYTIKGTLKLEQTLKGRGLADPKPKHNQKTSF